MDINEQLLAMRQKTVISREEKIQETIQKSKKVYDEYARANLLTYGEFLLTQLQYTRKRWWIFQGCLLLLAFPIIPQMQDNRVRGLGVIGCLFVILAIPELWRNKTTDSTQIEAACLYSLRQIYSARMLLFGIVDIFVLTLFCFALNKVLGLTVVELLSQLVLPVTITASICFWVFFHLSEMAALFACLAWGAAWWVILLNKSVYSLLFSRLWAAAFGASVLLLFFGICRMMRNTNRFWEESFREITID